MCSRGCNRIHVMCTRRDRLYKAREAAAHKRAATEHAHQSAVTQSHVRLPPLPLPLPLPSPLPPGVGDHRWGSVRRHQQRLQQRLRSNWASVQGRTAACAGSQAAFFERLGLAQLPTYNVSSTAVVACATHPDQMFGLGNQIMMATEHAQKVLVVALLGSAPARPLCLLRVRLAALGSSSLPERG